MKSQTKLFLPVNVAFFLASTQLFSAILSLKDALVGLEKNFLTDNGELILAAFIPVIFGLGWWLENLMENLVISKVWNKKWKNLALVMLSMPGILVMSIPAICYFTSGSFLRSITMTGGYMLVCGYFFRYSTLRSETIARLQLSN